MSFSLCVSLLVVSILAFCFCFDASIGDSCTPQYGFRVNEYDDKKISQSVMSTMNNLTKAECLAECYKKKYCLSVHFSPLEPACVALRERFDGVSVETTPTTGYLLFQTKKAVSEPGSDCEIDVDCVSLSNSHCHEGICRCDIGYGPNRTTCGSLAECSEFADNFTLFAKWVLHGYDIQSSGGKTRSTCMQFCLDNSQCKSADFAHASGACYLQAVTWLETSTHETTSPVYDFYQRECRTW